MTAEPGDAQYFVFPASRAQQRLYFLQRLLGDEPTYAIPLFFSIDGPLDVAALEASVRDLVERHEALRTHFAVEGTTLMQVIDPDPVPSWRVDTGHDVEAWMAAEARRPFDLDHGPLFRAALLQRDVGVDSAVLLLGMHHIVADGWSVGVLLRDLQECYRARVAGRKSDLPEPGLQYADFSAWQDEWLDGPAAAAQARYWAETLSGDLPVVRLPTDRPRRPGVPATAGDGHLFALPDGAVDGLRALCAAADRTLFAGLLAAFAVLLHRYTGLDDVIIGSPIANRTRHEFDDTVGLFVNTIAVRCDLAGDPTFREVLLRVGRATVDAYANQDLPFERVVQALNPDRVADRDPVFQVLFGLHNTPQPRWDLPGLLVSQLENPVTTAKFELSLDVIESGHGLAGVLQYRTELFDRPTVERLARHYCRLLESIAGEPDRAVATLPILGDPERAALLALPAEPPATVDRCCHELFAEQAALRPDAVAVSCGDTELTYRQLDERANRLAHRLRDGGVGPDVLVGLCAERSVDLVVGVLGIAKAGGAYVPLDPAHPDGRLAFLVRDTGLRHLVVHSGLTERLAGFTGWVVPLDDAPTDGPVPPPLVSGVTPDHLAYVIHTSGSTGRPKGTPVAHRNVTRLFTSTRRWFGFDHDDVWTLFHSIAFDFSVWELWGALTTGGRLVVVPHDVSRAPAEFHRLLCEQGVTVLNQTPSAFRRLMAADEHASGRLSLRHVVFGGEALEPATLLPWLRRHGDEHPRLANMYGITEITVHATYHRVRTADTEGGSVIGVPLPDLCACVLDSAGEPVPVGVPGELVIGGAGVTGGYLDRPELTAQRFVGHPADPALPAYRTGDLVRWLPSGALEYLGRIDDQVKIRGFRVEPGEIEAALVRHPDVREAAVLAATDSDGDRHLVGYVVAAGQDTAGLDAAGLRDHLRQTLPDHLVPAAFVVLDRFPLTHNGKVDRARLSEVDGQRAPAGRFAAPRTDVERALVEVWADVLGGGTVGIDDNYFALGGDSIRSIRLLAAAGRRGLRFTLPDLLRFQTIRGLAPHVTTGETATADRPHEPFALLGVEDRALVPDGVEDAYPLSRLQAGMLYHSELSAHRIYHNVTGYLVRAEYSEPAWRRAVATVLARHEILRTSFDLHTFAEPTQLVHPRVDPPITFEDLRDRTAAEQRTAAERRFADERARGFRWSVAPLIRLHVQRTADDRFRLWIAEHHAILDGWSERALFAELVDEYLDGLAGSERAPRPPPGVRFRAFVELEREALASAEHRRFWLDLVRDSTFAELPRQRPPSGEPDLRSLDIAVDAAESAGAARLARRCGVSVRVVLLAVHARVMGLLAGTTDVVTGVVHHGRPEAAGGDEVLGAFLNTLPLRVGLAGGTWAELVEAVAALDLAIQPHRRFPMAELRRELGRPLFDSFVNHTRFADTRRDGFDVLAADGVAATDFAFGAELSTSEAEIRLALRFDAARFDEDQVRSIGGYYRAALRAMARTPDGRYDIDLLSDEEHRRLDAWNATTEHYPQPHVLHELVKHQAERTPELVACAIDDEHLTYAELDTAADAVAHRLMELGAGPGRLVGVCLHRSLDLVVGLLAILKAGAGYVPIDPDDPPERITALAAEAGPALALAEPSAREPLQAAGVRVVDRFDGAADGPPPAVTPDDTAYLIFTSGSSGRPKGVVVSHRAICNRLLWMQRAYGLREGEVVLQKTPHTFDVSVWEFFWPLTTGGRVELARPGGHRDPAHLAALIRRRGVSTVHFVPSMLAAFLDHAEIEEDTTLRRVICSGEALPAELARRFLSVAPASVELHNLYGPTEAAVDVTHWRCADDGADSVPIGTPIANTTLHVLDPLRNPVPVGVTGELYLGGTGLADGYHGQPDLTAERFVAWTGHAGTTRRLYRTGDLVRHRADGALEFLGRADDQVKIRGFRVEPGEIEAALRRHDAVRDAAVSWSDDRLSAHVVLDRPAEPSELAAHLAGRLPEHLVPSRWTVLDALPVTRNGKVDRRALRATAGATVSRSAYTAPRDDREARLAGLFATVLGTGPVGVHDDFVALGGHSLSALRLTALVEHEFGRAVPLAALQRAGTVAGLAAVLRAGTDPDGNRLVPLRSSGTLPPLLLVHPAGGTVFCYRDLAAALPPGRPVHALAAAEPARSVEELADRYLPLITGAVAEGPYHLAGWSFGGVVAYELAQRLRRSGPVTLTMIDTGFPSGSPPADTARLFAEDLLRTNGTTAGDLDDALLARQAAVFDANLTAQARYRPAPYPGPVLTIHGDHGAEHAQAWRRVADPAVHVVPADHYDLMRPPRLTDVVHLLARFVGDLDDGSASAHSRSRTGYNDRDG